ncbi:MAG TPA: DUF983 domain-containing protein [Actinomycetota bacterium]|jgi:uncharacterized protein (DUF983 family)
MEGNGHAKRPSRIGAMLRMRCPRCLRGKLFRGMLDMWERCPQCGFVFEREEGYFTGAMYASTIITLPLVFLVFGIGWLLSSKTLLAAEVLLLVTALVTLPLIPLVFRYSRTLWLYFDWRFGPDRESEGRTGTREIGPADRTGER